MLIHLIFSQCLIIFAIKFNEFNYTLTLQDFKRNISFQQQQYIGMDVLPNQVVNFSQLQPINYQESRVIFQFKEILKESFLDMKIKDSVLYGLYKNCTLQIIQGEISSHQQVFKPNCLQLLIDDDKTHLAIIYQDSIILYNLEFDQVYDLYYPFSNNTTNIQLIQKYILISKGQQGLDILDYQGNLQVKNFMVNENVLQASIHAKKLLLLFERGLFIFNFQQPLKLVNKILVNECVRFEYNYKLLFIQTKTKIYEYFWKNLLINQEINMESEITSISLYEENLKFISNGYLHQKLVGIIKDDYNLSQIHIQTYQTNSTQIIGYLEDDYLILKQDQKFEIVHYYIQPAFLIFKTQEEGFLTCRVDLYQKDFINLNSTVKIIHYKLYFEVINDSLPLSQIIIVISVVGFTFILICFCIRRIYLKRNLKKDPQINEEKVSIDEEKENTDSHILQDSSKEEATNIVN